MKTHMFFRVVALLLAAASANDYLLSLNMHQTLNLTDGMQLQQLSVSGLEMYAMVNNQTHFQLLRYHWPDDFVLADEGPTFEAHILPGQSKYNPELTITTQLTVVYRLPNETDSTVVLLTSLTDLNSFSVYTFNTSFSATYYPSLQGFYLKYSEGGEQGIRSFPTSDVVVHSYNYSSLNGTIEDYLTFVSVSGKYVVTIDKPNGVVAVNTFRYNWVGTVNASSTQQTAINTTIISACLDGDSYVYLQTNESCLYRIRLSDLNSQCLNLVYTPTEQCYYESSTQSLILLESSNGTVLVNQLSLNSNSSQEYLINASRILLLGTYILYVGTEDSFFSFSIASCPTTYSYLQVSYKCESCKLGCDSCNGTLYCNTCSDRYVNTTFGSSYAQLYRNCEPCPSHCANCSSTTICITCDSGYLLSSIYQCEVIPVPVPVTPVTTMGISGLQAILNALTSITGLTNVIPSARSVLRPVLYILVSFDDFFPYMYHERFYGNTIEALFGSIHESETEKWSTYDNYLINPIFSSLGINQTQFTSELDHYYNYSSPVFIARDDNGESVLISVFSFITTNVVVSVILFVVFRLLFHLFFRFRISLMFRPQSFWPYLIFFIMEGNLQVISFYASSILRFNFFIAPAIKFQAALVYFFLFFLVIFGVAAYLLVFQKLGRLSKYFAENVNSSFHAISFLTFECGIKNILLALVHSLFRAPDLYKLQFSCLMCIELMCLTNYFFFLKAKGFFQFKAKTWLLMLLSMTRFTLIGVLFVQQGCLHDNPTLSLLDSTMGVVLTVYFLFIMAGFILNICFALLDLGKFIKNCIKNPTAAKLQAREPSVKSVKSKSSLNSKQKIEEQQKERVQNQKEMMRVYFAQRAISVKKPRQNNPGILKITTLRRTRPKVA